jgi:hypothetical protein
MITIQIPTVHDFWKALCRFAYRRWIAAATPQKPTGIPGNRDPEHPCTAYEPRARRLGDFPCNSEGHYLCVECAHFTPEETNGATNITENITGLVEEQP